MWHLQVVEARDLGGRELIATKYDLPNGRPKSVLDSHSFCRYTWSASWGFVDGR